MAWQYFTVCLFDFIFMPMIYTYVQLGIPEKMSQWDPITLRAGGLYHVAMGGMIGIYAWTRSLEKMKLMDNHIIPTDPDDELGSIDLQHDERRFDERKSIPKGE